MSLLRRWQVWRRRRKLKAAAKKQQAPPLREFIYLDEVSVYSLNAARLGSVAADFSETRSSSLRGQVGSSVGAGTAGTASAGVNSRLSAGQSRESQVTRTAIVQTAFKEFYELELELDSFAMRPTPTQLSAPAIEGIENLKFETQKASPDGWVVDPQMLERGRLVEAEVELDADDTFRTNEVISAMLEIVESNPEMFGEDVRTGLAQGKAIHQILEKLLGGLVPLRGRVLDYEVIGVDGREWIAHRRLIDQLALADKPATRPLYVVGVVEQELFWKDLRRMLFSGARFRVLVRMSEDGLQDTWTPVKLAHLLEPVAPDLASQLNNFGPEMIAAMSGDGGTEPDTDLQQLLGQRALITYGKKLAAQEGHELAAAGLQELETIAGENAAYLETAPGRQQAFGKIYSVLHGHFNSAVDPEVAAACRSTALQEAGLDPFGQPTVTEVPGDMPATTSTCDHPHQSHVTGTASSKRYLDSEVVAIYW